ncbi:MAG: alpha/beta hydrolase [Opitutaceae bacterium]
MKRNHLQPLLLLLSLVTSVPLDATEPEVIALWPEGVPDLRSDAAPERVENNRVSEVHYPTLTVFRVADNTTPHTGVVVCPGGGYARLAIDHEGYAIARWLNERGVNAFVLRYRLREYGHPAPLRDVLRAIRTVRSRAADFGVDGDRIGVIGFSAGGHLASSAATLFDHPDGRTGAALDAMSARPDFAALVYPVITMDKPFTHGGLRRNLLGEAPAQERIMLLSTDRQITPETPPIFLVHCADDKTVPLENSLLFLHALRKAGVPCEAHLHETGGHGFGMRESKNTVSDWPARLEAWLRFHGWLEGKG